MPTCSLHRGIARLYEVATGKHRLLTIGLETKLLAVANVAASVLRLVAGLAECPFLLDLVVRGGHSHLC